MLHSPIHANVQIIATALYGILISECTPLVLRRWILAQIRQLKNALPLERKREVEAAEAQAIIVAAAYLSEEEFNQAHLLLSSPPLQIDDAEELHENRVAA